MTAVMDPPETEALPDEATAIAEAPPNDAPAPIADPVVEVTTEDAVDAPPAPPAISDEERAFLSRRPYVMAALANVESAKADLSAATEALDNAKGAMKGKEAALEAAWAALYRAERDNPNGGMPLFDRSANNAPAGTAAITNAFAEHNAEEPSAEDVGAWNAKWDAFMSQPCSVLDISDVLKDKIREHGPENIKTLKDLANIKAVYPTEGYQVIKGIGEAKADAIDDAFEKLSAKFLDENPNPTPAPSPTAPTEAAAEAASDPLPTDYDFESTFPAAINPTPNETYDEDYHKSIIDDSIDALTELREKKESLSAGMVNGKALTDKTRKKLETAIGECQFQYDEGFDLYGGTFGRTAADRLRKHVESKVEKQASLKGGLE